MASIDLFLSVQVSWVRLPDWRIVASGRNVYNSNNRDGERYRVLHTDEASQDWTLQIKFATVADRGLYECQVATGTGILTHYFNVSVAVATTSIVGGHEYHVDKGSTIQLACIIHNVSYSSSSSSCVITQLNNCAHRWRKSRSSYFGTTTIGWSITTGNSCHRIAKWANLVQGFKSSPNRCSDRAKISSTTTTQLSE